MSRATKKLRALVFARAKGLCECGCGRVLGESGHLDHAFGRAKVAQAVENCWALALKCDDAKTSNRPSAAFWWKRFRAHCERHGYGGWQACAEVKLEVLRAKGRAA